MKENENKRPETDGENKPRKQVRNKAGRFLMDYWITSREYGKDNEKRYKEQLEKEKAEGKEHKWSENEKTYLIIIILGLIALGVKYIFF